MSIELFLAGGVSILFLLLALLFAALGEKGAMLVSGFNTMPKDKLDLCQYFRQKKLKGYAAVLSSSSSFCCGVI